MIDNTFIRPSNYCAAYSPERIYLAMIVERPFFC
jgi:hypothetical protein